jgi:hypothetical protein
MNTISVDMEQGRVWSECLEQFRREIRNLSSYMTEEETAKRLYSRPFFRKVPTIDLELNAEWKTFDHDNEDDQLYRQRRLARKSLAMDRKIEAKLKTFDQLSMQVEEQLRRGKLDKDKLIELNKKIGEFQINYGHIAAIAVTISALISGLNDLVELVQKLN